MLEPALTAMAAERMTSGTLVTFGAVLDRFCAAMGAAPAEAGRLDADFHLAIYEASGSELVNALRGYRTRLQMALSERVYTTEVRRRFVSEHGGILETRKLRDPHLAGERMEQHIRHERQALDKTLTAGPTDHSGRRASRGELDDQ